MNSTNHSKPLTHPVLEQYFPVISWLRSYSRQDLHGDIIAGIITAILLIPQAIAYAMLADLPPQLGLYASILPPLIYVLLGTSRTMSVGPVSIAAIMIASALTTPEIAELGSPVESAVILAMEGGLILLFMALLRMGGLVNFISHPVLTGFTTGAAILIIFSQLPHLIGITKPQCGLDAACYVQSLFQFNPYTLALGVGSLFILLLFAKGMTPLLKKWNLPSPIIMAVSKSAPLIVVIVTTILATHFDLSENHNVKIIGAIPAGLPTLNFDFLISDKWRLLLPYAGFIALIAYVESVAIAKVTAMMRNQRIDANQELIALVGCNIVSAISGGMSVAGGFSRTMVNYSAGARTQMAMLIAVVILSLAVIFFTDWFALIPKVTLAAIILIAIYPLVKIKNIYHTWSYDRDDGIAELATFLGVLFLGIEQGLMLGILFTIAATLRKTSQPHIAVVGRIPNTDHYRNIKRHQTETWDNLLLIRIDENITFSNIGFIEDFLINELTSHKNLEHIVFILTSVSHIDTTALEALENIKQTLEKQGITLHLAEVKGPVLDKLEQSRFLEQLKPGLVFFSIHEAVDRLTKDLQG